MKQTSEFINKLADLLDEYDVALCANTAKDSEFAEVEFIKTTKTSREVFTNGRSHSTGYEFRCRVDQMIRTAKVEKF